MIPASPCERFLELCCGTGIAALLAARNGAKHAYAFDIAARSVPFAEFNRRLNGLESVTIREGDLYSPSAGERFDRIVAHPPYVPVLQPKYASLWKTDWKLESQKLFTDAPFKMQLEASGWTLQLLAECDGTRMGEQLFDSMKVRGIVEPDTPFRDFADVLTVMVSGGYLRIANK